MDGFADMLGLDVFAAFEIGDGAGDFADFVEGAGGEAEFFHALLHEFFAGGVEFTVLFELGFGHGGVGHRAVFAEAGALEGDGASYFFAHLGGGGAGDFAGEVAVGDGGDFEVDIDAIEQRAGDAGHVAFHAREFGGGGFARVDGAFAGVRGVHGGDEHEAGGEGDGGMGARDGDHAGLEGLAQDFENGTGEFGEFIEEKDAMVGEGDFAGARDRAATDDGGAAGGVVWRADGAGADEGFALGHEATGGVDAGGFEGFLTCEGREDGGEAFAEHGFACTGRAQEQNIVAAGGGDGEGAFGKFLAADFAEVFAVGGGGGVDGVLVEFIGEEVELAVEEADEFGQGADGDDVDSGDDGGFRGVVGGKDDADFFLFAGEHGHGECALDGADAAIEGELAGDEIFFVVDFDCVAAATAARGIEDAINGEDSQGHRQFQGVAFFAEVGGGEIDGEEAFGEAVAAVEESGADAVEGFFDGGVGEADDGGFGAGLGAFGVIDFDFAGKRIDALQNEGVDFGEHGFSPG